MIVGIIWIALIYVVLADAVYEGIKLINSTEDDAE